MKKTFILLGMLFIASLSFAQCSMSITGEVGGQPVACGVGFYTQIINALDGTVGANLHARQVWALHYRNEVSDLDQGDAQPALTLVPTTTAGCTGTPYRCYAVGADNCSNYNTSNSTDHCKFVWLIEQLRSGVGEFVVIVGGGSGSNLLAAETIQTKMVNRAEGCNAAFTPVIGDCGDGSGQPCVDSWLLNTPVGSTTVTLSWAMPSSVGLIYTRDTEDSLGAANACAYDTAQYAFNPADRAAALTAMITGWEIFYTYEDGSPGPSGDRDAAWVAVDDTDGTRAQVGAVWYSTNTSATVVVPNPSNQQILFSVSPIFDGNPGPGRTALGTKSVTLTNVQSRSSVPVNPTPVTFQSFTGAYTDMQHVVLTWVTASETDALGFNVFRSLDGASWTQVNSALIPAKGQGGAGASYAYTDNLPKQRVYQKWQYKVEELSSDNQRVGEATTEVTK